MRKKKDREIELLLQIVKGSAILETPVSTFSATRLIQLAERHKVVYQLLLFAQHHKTFFTGGQLDKLENRCRESAVRSLNQLHELRRIAGVLNGEGIDYVCIKGPQLSRMIYGREALKESVDLDIMLVNADDLVKVHPLLTRLGYSRSNLNQYESRLTRKIFLIAKREVHYFSRETRCSIDLHIRPGANTYLTASNFSGFFSDLITDDLDGTPVTILPDEAYFVYLCYHGSLHQFSRLAWLMDIRAFLMLKRKSFDYKVLLSVARSLQVERCVLLTLLLLKQYFGEEIPAPFLAAMPKAGSVPGIPKHMRFLVSVCMRMPGRDAGYGMSLRGRIEKVFYIMILIKGIVGKIDWLYGILMRFIVKRFL